jgi:hypothetical protein
LYRFMDGAVIQAMIPESIEIVRGHFVYVEREFCSKLT